MNRLFFIIAYIVIGLFMGLFFSDHMGADLAAIDWANLWVWGWIVLWPIFLIYYFFVIFAIFVGIAALFMLGYAAGQTWGWWS